MVSQIYTSVFHLNKATTSYTEPAFSDMRLYCFYQNYDKREDFDFEIVNFPLLDGDVPRSTSFGVYISQLIRFARAST